MKKIFILVVGLMLFSFLNAKIITTNVASDEKSDIIAEKFDVEKKINHKD